MQAALGPLALAAQAATPIVGAISSMRQAREMREQERINAEWGRIRANQTDTAARTGMEAELGEMRSVLNANDAGINPGTIGLLDEVRQIRGRDRRIEVGNRNREVSDANRRAASYRPGLELTRGIMRAGPSLFELYGELRR